MSQYRARPSRPDRAKALGAMALIYAAIAALFLIRPDRPAMHQQPPPTVLIDITPPTPPPPPAQPRAGRTRDEEGAAGKKAEPTPVVAPPARLPAPTPIPAAPVAGTGAASTAGAADAGAGPGAGGAGNGRGGGGNGGGIGTLARLISGGLTRSDYRSIRGLAGGASSGQARLALSIGPDGRVARCSIANSSGNGQVDAALCAIVEPRMRWAAARDTAGNPISVGVYYVATWQRF